VKASPAAGVVLLALVLATAGSGGTAHVTGTQAGDLDAGSIITVAFALGRGQSFTLGENTLENVGEHPILVESVQPVSTSPALRTTQARLFLLPRLGHHAGVMGLPGDAPGWPARYVPKKMKGWLEPHPPILSLPTRRFIPPGRSVQVMYGIHLHSQPSARTRITGLRIVFKQGGTTYVWTLPSRVHLRRP